MSRFVYVVRNKLGNKETGTEDAASSEELISRLQARDLTVINISPESKEKKVSKGLGAKGTLKRGHYRVKSEDLVLFCRQIATLLSAGVTILKSLDIIARQVSSRRLHQAIQDLQKDMQGGNSFHEAMAKHPAVFSELWVNLSESGEASGNLAMVLSRLAGYLERSAAFKRKIVSMLMYPIILVAAALIALLILTVKIIPTFENLFKSFDITLPLLTRILMQISSFLRSYILFIFAGVVVGVILLRRYISTKSGRKRYEGFLFHLPNFGEFFRALVIERFTSEMSTLIESGVPLLYSLEIAEHSVNNLTLGDIIHQVKDEVREGGSLSPPLERSGFFEPMTVQMVAIGEEIGELSNMFKRLNTFYQEYVDTFLTRFTALFEPLLLVFIAIVVFIMLIGLFLPIFQISQLH